MMSEHDSYLLTAVRRGDGQAATEALDAGADINAEDHLGLTALSRAAASGDLRLVELLLDRGAAVDQGSKVGNTPLMAAVVRGHQDVVDVLLQNGANPTCCNKWGMGAADWARHTSNAPAILAQLRQPDG